jgi:tetratricopeptide (TPR) repeat protein
VNDPRSLDVFGPEGAEAPAAGRAGERPLEPPPSPKPGPAERLAIALRSEAVRAVLLGAAVFVVYGLGACWTVYVGDSGELATAVRVLGIPHPSGYPLYVLLGKLFTFLVPAGSFAWRLSLFSAAASAGACAVLYRLARAMGLGATASVAGALTLAFSPSFWAEANVQRVYGLGALFVVLTAWAAWRWTASRATGFLVLACFLCGLGASNHTFMAVEAVALGIFAVIVDPSLLRRAGVVALSVGAFALGLLPYVYLPLRSRQDPPLDWGNPETLPAFLGVVLRRDFWERRWVEVPSDILVVAWDWLRSFGPELAYVGAALALLGTVAWAAGWVGAARRSTAGVGGAAEEGEARKGSVRRARLFVLFPLLVMGGNLATMALHGSRTDIFVWHRYYIPSYLMASLLGAVGAQALVARLGRRAGALVLILPAVLAVTGWRAHDRSRFRIGEDYARQVLSALPPGAHLIAEDDNILFGLMYLNLAERVRPDVDLILQGVGGEKLPPLRFDPDTSPLYFTHHPNWTIPSLEIVPLGVVFKAVRSGSIEPEPFIRKTRLDGEQDPLVPKDYLTQNLIGQFHYMLGLTFESFDWLRARLEFERAEQASPDNDVLFFNLGLIYRRNGLTDDAIACFTRSDAINPRAIANKAKPRAKDKLIELAGEKYRLGALERAQAEGDAALGAMARGSAVWHTRLAELLEKRGETLAARGHRLRAIELGGAPFAPALPRSGEARGGS